MRTSEKALGAKFGERPLGRTRRTPCLLTSEKVPAEFVTASGCVSAAPPGGSVRVVRWTTYTTRTPLRPLGPLLLDVAAGAIWLVYAGMAPRSYTLQRLSADCGSEGRGFEPRRSPPLLQVKRGFRLPGRAPFTATVLQPARRNLARDRVVSVPLPPSG